MKTIENKFWLAGNENSKLRALAQSWWERVEGWLRFPLSQFDAELCTLPVLNLLAWQRDIERGKDEPLRQYRLRVKYACVNAQDAGSTAGFVRIFQRLEIGAIVVKERNAGMDWDIVLLELNASQLAENMSLLDFIIRQYGRTCRRYEFEVITPISIGSFLTEFNNDWQTFIVK